MFKLGDGRVMISSCSCSPPRCPSLEIEGDKLFIYDDYQGMVTKIGRAHV